MGISINYRKGMRNGATNCKMGHIFQLIMSLKSKDILTPELPWALSVLADEWGGNSCGSHFIGSSYLHDWCWTQNAHPSTKYFENYFQEMLLVCAEISNLPWTVAIGLHIISLALSSIAVPHLVMLLFSQGHWLLGLALLIFTRHWHRFFNILEMPNLLREEGRDWRWKDRRGNFSPWFCFMVKRLLMPWCVTEPSNFWRFYS